MSEAVIWFVAGLAVGAIATRLLYARVFVPKMQAFFEKVMHARAGAIYRLAGQDDLLEEIEGFLDDEAPDVGALRIWLKKRAERLGDDAEQVGNEAGHEVVCRRP